jgi:RHS repeat-associated protein
MLRRRAADARLVGSIPARHAMMHRRVLLPLLLVSAAATASCSEIPRLFGPFESIVDWIINTPVQEFIEFLTGRDLDPPNDNPRPPDPGPGGDPGPGPGSGPVVDDLLIEDLIRWAEVPDFSFDIPIDVLPDPDPEPAAPVTPESEPTSNTDAVTDDELEGIRDDCDDDCLEAAAGGGVRSGENQTGSQAGGKILPFNGQEMLDELDLFVLGRDPVVDVRILRRHLSGVRQHDPHVGPAWALSYVKTLMAIDPESAPTGLASEDLVLRTFGRTERYRKVAPNTWEGRDGRFDRIVYNGSGTAMLGRPGGTMYHFHVMRNVDAGGRVLIVGQLATIFSSRGNRLRIHLDPSPPSGMDALLRPRRILSISDSFGRPILFSYEDPLHPSRLTRIVDFSGRQVRYAYTCLGQLGSVETPAVQSTAGLNDFASSEKRTTYQYVEESTPLGADRAALEAAGQLRFEVSLAGVVRPSQQSGGTSRLAWSYYDEPGSLRHGRVKTHSVGSSDPNEAGGTYSYDYSFLLPSSPGPNVAAVRTTVIDREGTRTELDYTSRGQLLAQQTFTRGLRSGEPAFYTRLYEYNADGETIQATDETGLRIIYIRNDTPDQPRRSQRSILSMRIEPSPGQPADQPAIDHVRVYEPVFNRVFQEIDPRGYEPGNDPADFTTTYVYDYMEDLEASSARFAMVLGAKTKSVSDLMAERGIVSVGDVNGDGVTSQMAGNVVRVLRPRVVLPGEAARVGLSADQEASETFRYNRFGQKVRHVDAEGNVHAWEYYPASDPDGDGVLDMPGADPVSGGYLKAEVWDTTEGAERNSGSGAAPVQRRIEYEYVAQGAFPASPRGVPTAIVDPRGIRHVRLVNERDQIVRRVRAADVSASLELGLVAYGYEEITLYDGNDNVVEQRIERTDTADGPDGFIVHHLEYDLLDQRVGERWDVGGLAIENRYAYDSSQNLVEHVRGVGSGEQSTTRWTFDERDLPIARTHGFGSPEASATSTHIDAHGDTTAMVDADGDASQVIRDGYHRVKESMDRVGNRTVLTYDSASHVVRLERYGPVDETASTETLLARADATYDTRGRRARVDRALFHHPGPSAGGAVDGGDLHDRAPSTRCGAASCVSRIWVHDRASRVVGVIDADDELYETRYDGLSRVVETIDPEGSRTLLTYDRSGHLIQQTQIETSPLLSTPEVFTTQWVYDALGRVEAVIEPNGQTTEIAYDSRDNPIRQIDALGNETEWRYDRLDRPVSTRRYLAPLPGLGTAATASGGRASQRDVGQGGGDGIVETTQAWDDLHRLVEQTDDNGGATTYVYDDLDRRVAIVHPDQTVETLTYSPDDELLAYRNPNGSVATWTYDAAVRPLQMTVSNAASPATRGTTARQWGYDGLDRVTFAFDDNGAGPDVAYRYAYDSLSRPIRETQLLGDLPPLDVAMGWRADAQRARTLYPNGRVVTATHDGLDREIGLFEGASTTPGAAIATFDYVGGGWRDVRIAHANGTSLDRRNAAGTQTIGGTAPGYDANRRNVLQRWRGPAGSLVTGYASAYNATNVVQSELREHLARADRYTLDSLSRRVAFDHNAPSPTAPTAASRLSTWQLDGVHSWRAYTRRGESLAPVVDLAGGVNEYQSFGGATQLHDANGSRVQDGRHLYTYDFASRLVAVADLQGTPIASYTYDDRNRRVLKQTATETTRYLYRGWEVIEERTVQSPTQELPARQYVYREGIDRPVQLQSLTGPGAGTYYYHLDPRGSVGALTNATGGTLYHAEYDAYGEGVDGSPRLDPATTAPLTDPDPTGNPYLWQARRLDPETGLYYYRNRYYDPEQGRFLQADPIGTWGDLTGLGSRYAFAGAVPGWTDPDGREALPPYYHYPSDGPFQRAAQAVAQGILGIFEGVAAGSVGAEFEGPTSFERDVGRAVGAAAVEGAGALGAAIGCAEIAAGTTACATGVGCVAGLPAAAVGAATAAAGTAVAINAGSARRSAQKNIAESRSSNAAGGGSTVTKTRQTPGRDGATSGITLEKDAAGSTVSRTHTVTKDGQVIHQHQEHIGKYGGERRFPDEWTGTPTINAPPHTPKPPSLPPGSN